MSIVKIYITGKINLSQYQKILIKLRINIAQKYKNHPSIGRLKRNCKGISYFLFQPISVDEVIKVVKNLKVSKAVGGDIPTEILKECEFTFDIITAGINKAIEIGNFSDDLKMANVTPVFKKEDPL